MKYIHPVLLSSFLDEKATDESIICLQEVKFTCLRLKGDRFEPALFARRKLNLTDQVALKLVNYEM